jgi:hypothetical protein
MLRPVRAHAGHPVQLYAQIPLLILPWGSPLMSDFKPLLARDAKIPDFSVPHTGVSVA